jgi:copper transport protein
VTPSGASGVAARLLGLLALLVTTILATAGPAAAHAALVSSQPGAGYAVTSAPDEIVLQFSDAISLVEDALTLTGPNGEDVPLRVSLHAAGTAVRGEPTGPIGSGAYQVGYRVVARDGDLITGAYPFGVATPVSAAASAGSATVGDPNGVRPGTAWWRALLFLGLSLALGGAYTGWRVRERTGGLPGPRPLVRTGALAAAVGAAGLLLTLAPVGELPTAMEAPGAARLVAAQAVLLLMAALVAHRPTLLGAGPALLAVVVLEGVRAHLGEAAGIRGMALTSIHLLVGALWLGGLVHVLRVAVAWRGRRLAVHEAFSAYARSALVLFVVVALTGTLSALLLLPTAADWTGTSYGRVLLTKLALFTAVVLAALAGRRRLHTVRPRTPDGDPSGPTVGRSARMEAGLLAALVVVTAALTSATPARLVPASAVLTAPVGPVLRTAERIGQVSVSIVASEGRVEVRADTPDDGRPVAVDLTARLTAPSGDVRPLDLSACGSSCWAGPATWSDGVNTLTVDVDAGRWEAGTVDLAVPWPLTPAPALLARVQQNMGSRSALDTVETVTSGFGNPGPTTSRRTGQEYLESQPWSDGGATDAVVLRDGDERTLLFALPALGYHFAMRLDGHDRVIAERIVTPNHLIVRRYTFPDDR